MMQPSNELPAVYLCRDVVYFRKGINGLARCWWKRPWSWILL